MPARAADRLIKDEDLASALSPRRSRSSATSSGSSPRQLIARTTSESTNMELLRTRYITRLGHMPRFVSEYVPNIAPFLIPQNQSCSSFVPALQSPAFTRDDAMYQAYFAPGSISSGIITVSAAALGAGALALPDGFHQSGLVCGIITMAACLALSTYSINILVRVIEHTGCTTYEEISMKILGRKLGIFIEFNLILFCYGSAIAYAITIGDLWHSSVKIFFTCTPDAAWYVRMACDRNLMQMLICFGVLLPLCLIDKLNELRWTSLLGVCCILCLIIVVIYVFLITGMSSTLDWATTVQPTDALGLIRMWSIAVFAYACQPNVPIVYVELRNRSFDRMGKVATGSMSLCFFIYFLMGLHGYMVFGTDTQPNILQNLASKVSCGTIDPLVSCAYVAMMFALIMAFPLNIFPVKYSVEALVLFSFPFWEDRLKLLRTIVTVTCLILTVIFSILIPSVRVVFELVGAFSGSIVCYIAPALFYMGAVPGPYCSSHKLGAILLLFFGFAALVLGTGKNESIK